MPSGQDEDQMLAPGLDADGLLQRVPHVSEGHLEGEELGPGGQFCRATATPTSRKRWVTDGSTSCCGGLLSSRDSVGFSQ